MKQLSEYHSFRELSEEFHGPANAWHLVKMIETELNNKLQRSIDALKQCRIYSECYDELILTIDEALIELQTGLEPE